MLMDRRRKTGTLIRPSTATVSTVGTGEAAVATAESDVETGETAIARAESVLLFSAARR